MEIFLASFLIIVFAVAAMAVGVIVTGRTMVKGSCGGLGNIEGLEGSCQACSGQGTCREKRRD